MVVIAGVALRLVFYFRCLSLRQDEVRLALNIVSRSYLQLLQPLANDQSAPILFLLGERLATSMFGANELALRLLPMLAGAGFLLMLPPLAGRLIGWSGAALATAMAASAPVLVNYSNEAKQYMLEALVTVMLLGIAIQWLDAPASSRARLRLLVAGVVAVWLSGPAVFVLPGVLLGGLITAGWSDSKTRRFCVGATLLWGCAFGLAYWLVYSVASRSTYMSHFWAPAFLNPALPDLWYRAWRAAGDVLWGYVAYAFDLGGGLADNYLLAYMVVVLGLAAVGVRRLYRVNGPPVVVLCVSPVIVSLTASVLGAYPLNLRLMLFAIPIFYLVVSRGVIGLVDRMPSPLRQLLTVGLTLLLVTPSSRLSAFMATSDIASEPVRQLVGELGRHQAPGDAVYVFARSIPEWAFYTTDWSHPDTARVAWLERQSSSAGPAFENAPSRGRRVRAVEGQGLVRSFGRGVELLGLPSGMERRAVYRVQAKAPDSGWVAHEAQRIRAVAQPAVWVLMTNSLRPEEALLDTLRRSARVTYLQSGRKFALVRFEFAGCQ